LQGVDVGRALAAERRHKWSRAELAQFPGFDQYSPQPGSFDREAFRVAMGLGNERTFEMLPRLAKAADVPLQRHARRIAARVILREAQARSGGVYGAGRRKLAPFSPDGDLDIDASIEGLLRVRTGHPIDQHELMAQVWRRPDPAVCLVVDTSGSMSGSRLANAALAAAAIALRAGADYSVVAVCDRALIVKDQGSLRPIDRVVDDLLGLRSYGWTDLALGLRAARAQLARSARNKRVAVLLTDGRWNRGADPLPGARALDVLHVLATAGRADTCRELAAAGRGRVEDIAGVEDIVRALHAVLSDL
jgi:Mg-chelatase subunit ChlD